jgi:hypothetical protein
MSDLILRREDIDRFTAVLSQLLKKAHVSLSALIHRDGHLLACSGANGIVDTTALSALVSANFSSMVAVANLVGEKEFTTQHHVGRSRSIYISLVDEYTFLVSVFDVNVPTDPIRVYTEEYRGELESALNRMYNNEPDGDLPSAEDFKQAQDAAEAAQSAQAQARRLTYTVKPPGAAREDAPTVEKAALDRPPAEGRARIREPQEDDVDMVALANAISLRKKDQLADEKPAGHKDVLVVDGKVMNVVSLRKKADQTRPRKSETPAN